MGASSTNFFQNWFVCLHFPNLHAMLWGIQNQLRVFCTTKLGWTSPSAWYGRWNNESSEIKNKLQLLGHLVFFDRHLQTFLGAASSGTQLMHTENSKPIRMCKHLAFLSILMHYSALTLTRTTTTERKTFKCGCLHARHVEGFKKLFWNIGGQFCILPTGPSMCASRNFFEARGMGLNHRQSTLDCRYLTLLCDNLKKW
jgi:hypothetical protein